MPVFQPPIVLRESKFLGVAYHAFSRYSVHVLPLLGSSYAGCFDPSHYACSFLPHGPFCVNHCLPLKVLLLNFHLLDSKSSFSTLGKCLLLRKTCFNSLTRSVFPIMCSQNMIVPLSCSSCHRGNLACLHFDLMNICLLLHIICMKLESQTSSKSQRGQSQVYFFLTKNYHNKRH